MQADANQLERTLSLVRKDLAAPPPAEAGGGAGGARGGGGGGGGGARRGGARDVEWGGSEPRPPDHARAPQPPATGGLRGDPPAAGHHEGAVGAERDHAAARRGGRTRLP